MSAGAVRRRGTAAPWIAIALVLAAGAEAAPEADLWQRWAAHAPESTLAIDHLEWQVFLDSYLLAGADGVNRVAYGRVSAADRARLADYVLRMSEVAVSTLNRSEQRAYWINLYNALTVRVVVEHYPVASIRDIDISPGLFADGPWRKKLVEVESVPVSLDDIEHRILRPIWRDPRIHYAVNCAAVGCPNLQPLAYSAANAERLLSEAARAYVNHPRGVRLDEGGLVLSSLYVWYADDFGDDEAGLIAHLAGFAAPALRARLKRARGVADHAYDWALNDAR